MGGSEMQTKFLNQLKEEIEALFVGYAERNQKKFKSYVETCNLKSLQEIFKKFDSWMNDLLNLTLSPRVFEIQFLENRNQFLEEVS